ncbi:hypothetical protein Clo1100_3360 [Clostridium sp. BNL1100]|nr:hypothetical protein Clo1100_3360 [Clostridium sp. BNL1100]
METRGKKSERVCANQFFESIGFIKNRKTLEVEMMIIKREILSFLKKTTPGVEILIILLDRKFSYIFCNYLF